MRKRGRTYCPGCPGGDPPLSVEGALLESLILKWGVWRAGPQMQRLGFDFTELRARLADVPPDTLDAVLGLAQNIETAAIAALQQD